MDNDKKLTDYLETILNLQCENQEALNGLLQENKQLLEQLFQKTQESNARVKNLQMEVMDVQDALRPSSSLELEEEPETPPGPDLSHLLSRVGTAALLSPLLWNLVAAGVRLLQGRAWDLAVSGALAMTACICVAWGLLLIAVEPLINQALERREQRRLARETEEDRAIEEYLNQRCSRKTECPTDRTHEN